MYDRNTVLDDALGSLKRKIIQSVAGTGVVMAAAGGILVVPEILSEKSVTAALATLSEPAQRIESVITLATDYGQRAKSRMAQSDLVAPADIAPPRITLASADLAGMEVAALPPAPEMTTPPPAIQATRPSAAAPAQPAPRASAARDSRFRVFNPMPDLPEPPRAAEPVAATPSLPAVAPARPETPKPVETVALPKAAPPAEAKTAPPAAQARNVTPANAAPPDATPAATMPVATMPAAAMPAAVSLAPPMPAPFERESAAAPAAPEPVVVSLPMPRERPKPVVAERAPVKAPEAVADAAKPAAAPIAPSEIEMPQPVVAAPAAVRPASVAAAPVPAPPAVVALPSAPPVVMASLIPIELIAAEAFTPPPATANTLVAIPDIPSVAETPAGESLALLTDSIAPLPGAKPPVAEEEIPTEIYKGPDALKAVLTPEPPKPQDAARPVERLRPKTPAEILGLNPKQRARAERCLAEAVYFESRNEPVRGQIAVAQVVMNRVFSPYYPGEVCAVVYQNAHRHLSCQFTFACDGIPERVTERGPWARAQRIARQTLDGAIWRPEVAKATHYHADYVKPKWIRDMRTHVKHGRHIFYRPRNWGDGRNELGWVRDHEMPMPRPRPILVADAAAMAMASAQPPVAQPAATAKPAAATAKPAPAGKPR